MYVLANPQTFMRLSGRVLPWLAGFSVLSLVVGLTLAMLSPADYQQGETVKIMFIHVPAAWVASLAYVVMTAAALGTLVWRHPLAEAAQKAAVPLGAGFTFICLVTGSLWGKPMWGTYWVWDARLTSMLVLFITYLGLLALWHTIEEPGRAARAASILTLVGSINLPIVKFSVDWWEHLAPAGLGVPHGRPDDRQIDARSVAHHGGIVHGDLHDPAPGVDPQRGSAPPPPPADDGRCGRPRSRLPHGTRRGALMMAVPHIGFILAAYALTAAAMAGMVVSVVMDGRALRRALDRLDPRRGGRRDLRPAR